MSIRYRDQVTPQVLSIGRQSFSAHTYVVNAVENVKILLQEEGRGLKSTAKTPFPSTTYRPEVDVSDECADLYASRYQNLVGVLRWAVELGRIDISTEVALLLQHLALPSVGHLNAVYHVFAYLNKLDKSRIIFDPTDPVPVTPSHHRPDWSSFYSHLRRCLNRLATRLYCMYSIAGNVVTRRSHTGTFLFVQNLPIQWLSKRQNTVKTLTFWE